ncbi:uncharacterized protein LOC142987119 [Anticarsia gemmatalis]|uniref:uncharacterized protein LOC142987119 n=1 Tax=Anticarsia gemmatalis TaxID=129554 RepID=UPI003F76134C
MKYLLLLLSACWCASAIQPEMYSLLDAGRHFVQFTQRFNKHYHSDEERAARFQIFKDNLLEANRLNRESDNAVFGISKFMDLTTDEFVQQYAGIPINATYGAPYCIIHTDATEPFIQTPPTLDFRQNGYVTAIKNQGRCGSCYAFSAIGNIEGQCAKHFGVHKQLSEQQIVDCAAGTNGCTGGWQTEAFRSLIDLGGSVSLADYPYIQQRGQCKRPQPSAILSGCRRFKIKSQEKLKQVVYNYGPMSITLEPARLKMYISGTLTDTMCYQPNQKTLHAAVIIGYGIDEKNIPYWLIKNSWGANWGDHGFFKFQRGEGAFSCGMMKYQRSSAIVSSCKYAMDLQKPLILDAERHFVQFTQRFNKHYHSDEERAARFQIFKDNLLQANRLNSTSDAVFGITKLMDLTPSEFRRLYTGLKSVGTDGVADVYCNTIVTDKDITYSDAPDSFDWRDENVVTAVKDQGGCGSCFAFSTTGLLEGQYAIKNKVSPIGLSEQQILDCDHNSSGCGGGLMSFALKSLIKEGGSIKEEEYDYEGSVGECRTKNFTPFVKVKKCLSYNMASQEKLKQILYNTGPISIAIQAEALQLYSEGIVSDEECNVGDVNHAVLLVGYGSGSTMKYMLLLLSACWCASAIQPEMYSLLDAGRHFVQFTQRFNKHYHSDEERAARFQIFKDNLLEANRLNKESDNAVFGISKFMDLTTDEFVQKYAGIPINATYGAPNCLIHTDGSIPFVRTPRFLDFRQNGYVTAVKNQGHCGACYAFAAIGNIEGQCAKNFGVRKQLSEQQIIDCAARTNGCRGGHMSEAFRSLIDLGGSIAQAQYPYVAQRGRCMRARPTARLSGCRIFRVRSQEKLKQALYRIGPISITLEPARLKLYVGGTLTDAMCYQPNQRVLHAAVIVGYGIDNKGVPYWLVKNSWGANWGDHGYFKFQRGEGAYSCGMMKYQRTSAIVRSCE